MAKFMRKPIAFLLLAVMLMQMLPVIAFATGSEMKLTVSSATGYTGETVEITVAISNNPGISSLMFDIEYDSVLTLTDVTFSEAFGSLVTTPEPYTNPQTITLISPYEDVTANGVLATLTFEVSKEATHDYVADVEITFDENNIFNASSELVATSAVNGAVTVFRGIPGDINSDRVVDTKDAVLLFRYVAGWDVTVDSRALDCNGDGIVNTHDPIALFRYVAGWPGINLYYGVNYDYYSRGLKYSINSDGISYSVAMGDCTDTDVVIPLTYNGLPVTGISKSGFSGCTDLKSISIPNTVTKIGNHAFTGCENLTYIDIPNDVTSIGEAAFNSAGLTSIIIPDGVTEITASMFGVCKSLVSVKLPDNLISIGGNAFNGCSSLVSVTIPDGTTTIGAGAFSYCYALSSITIPASVTSIGNEAFRLVASIKEVHISDIGAWCETKFDYLQSNPLSLSKAALYLNGSLVTKLVVPDSVTGIEGYAFDGCSSITSVTIPEGVESIGSFAFRGCSNITSVSIPNGMTDLGFGSFSDCNKLERVAIPDSVTSIPSKIFMNCSSITSVVIPKSVTSIGESAFDGCSGLTEVHYAGTTSEWWDGITIEVGNAYLKNAMIYFESELN